MAEHPARILSRLAGGSAMFCRLALLLCLALSPLTSHAQTSDSGLGILGGGVTLAHAGGNTPISRLDAYLDTAITRHHGAQLDFGLTRFPGHDDGRIALHLYMAPGGQAKYGVFAAYSDVNNHPASARSAGIEALWALGPRALIEARAGIGTATGSNDFVFASLRGQRAITAQLTATARLGLIDLDEKARRHREIVAGLGLTYRLSQNLSLGFGVTHSHITGRPALADDTSAHLTLTARFGTAATRLRAAPFSPIRPLTGLYARGALPIP
ncbi:hypothetical protein U5922_006695 [Aquicoccus sp. G2-2]|uniref:hypothetical protein n=1 Tax=Aquicoccus sp. G2-2 TaxID=3092120 RepID=UPI002ADF7B5C|nr:hypothetical protein [Aquicoccus sp. G2-2]MEA1113177.1 hypothetical protein [Aquicoccus sp. G2-2]